MGDHDVIAGEPARLILDAVCGLRTPIGYGELRYRPRTTPRAVAALRRAIDRVSVAHVGEETYDRLTRFGLGDGLRMHVLVDVLEQLVLTRGIPGVAPPLMRPTCTIGVWEGPTS